ncbi:MAG: hypothetical protein JSS61_06530 [Verrucomicrobia bacterium]|nr:hypothetical protein [Verrucomicrobiota bacterium]
MAILPAASINLLNHHLQEKFINQIWLAEVLQGKKSYFPYSPKENGIAEINEEDFLLDDTDRASQYTGPATKFLINIPMGHLPMEKGHDKITRLLKLFETQAYGDSSDVSREKSKKRLAVVIGLNQIQSIDPMVNRAFEKYIASIPNFDAFPAHVTGFFWIPQWEQNPSWQKELPAAKKALKKRPKLKQLIYSKERAFLILKCLNRSKALSVRRSLEGRVKLSKALASQIPYQKIRETIKNSSATADFAKVWHKRGDKVFFVTMDADVRRLRRYGKGYFTRCEEIIDDYKTKHGHVPSAISLGYHIESDDCPLAALAVECDMAVRRAMNKCIPGSVYLPEPGTAYYLSKEKMLLKNLEKFSFCGEKSEERAFESRRALSSGIKTELFDISRIVFNPEGALITTMPSRMKTETCAEFDTLTAGDLKKEKVLKALRGISQVHFHPFHWGHYLYEGLPNKFKTGRGVYGKLNGILRDTFVVFDPISLVQNYKDTVSSSHSSAHETIFSVYDSCSKAIYENKSLKEMEKVKELKRIAPFVRAQCETLSDAKSSLKAHGFSPLWIEKIVKAAKASGAALHETLENYS